MKRSYNQISYAIIGALMAVAPRFAMAAATPPALNPPGQTGSGSTTTLGGLAAKVIGWLLIIAGAVAVIFLIIGGIRYIVSAGNSDQIEKAKHTILYSILGIIVVLLSYIIVFALQRAASSNA